MKKYENPEIEAIVLEDADVILTSFVDGGTGSDEDTGTDGGWAEPTRSILDE